MPFKDREYRLKYRRKWYAKNRESEIAHVVRRKREIKEWLASYKGNLSCKKCGENHPATLEFHHKKGSEKGGAISYLADRGCSIKKILEEMKKCEVLCSNCHQKLHHYERKANSKHLKDNKIK